MKIIIEDGLSLNKKRGVGQYTERLYELLSKEYDVEMRRKYFLENIKNSTLRRILYTLWLNTFFVIKLLFLPSGTICFFTATTTPFFKIKKIKYFSIMHDIRAKVHPELSTNMQNKHANFINWTAITFADKLITVSKTVKKEIIDKYKIDKNKIEIIYNLSSIASINYDANETILKKYNIKPKKYLFFIGGLDKNKNVLSIIEAFNLLTKKYSNLQLVIAGNKGNDNLLNTNNENIIYTGFITDEDVKVLYENALIYIFPSLYEGFGIPILDAQFSKVPVICSDIPVFHEVAEDSVEFCKPDTTNLSQAIEKLLKSEEYRNSLIFKGLKNIKRYSSDVIKKQLLGVLSN